MRKIAIIGATGMLGQPVTKELIKSGFDITIFARNSEKARQIFGSTVHVIEGDLSETEKLKELLSGQEGVYLNLSVEQNSKNSDFQPEREGLLNIIKVAKDSGIKRIAYISSLVHFYQGQNGFNWWVFDIKQKAVDLIKNCGIPYIIFYPSTFMECFDKGAYRQGNNLLMAGTSKHKMFLISGHDYGKQVVNALYLSDGNKDYTVQGQEAFTATEAAKYFVENFNRYKLKIRYAPIGVLRFFGIFSTKLNYGAKIVEALNNYPEKFDAEKTWKELGVPETKFIDYIRNS